MQKVKGVCTACGGDGLRQQVGRERGVPKCTHCGGSGMEPMDEELREKLEWARSGMPGVD